MTPKQKNLILRFMRMMLWEVHPNFNEYPIAKMESIVDEELAVDGTGFENTELSAADELIQAFWMNRLIKEMEAA